MKSFHLSQPPLSIETQLGLNLTSGFMLCKLLSALKSAFERAHSRERESQINTNYDY